MRVYSPIQAVRGSLLAKIAALADNMIMEGASSMIGLLASWALLPRQGLLKSELGTSTSTIRPETAELDHLDTDPT